jgi:hypothetical protein
VKNAGAQPVRRTLFLFRSWQEALVSALLPAQIEGVYVKGSHGRNCDQVGANFSGSDDARKFTPRYGMGHLLGMFPSGGSNFSRMAFEPDICCPQGKSLMPTTFWGLFLFSTALSLTSTFTVVGAIALVSRRRDRKYQKPHA